MGSRRFWLFLVPLFCCWASAHAAIDVAFSASPDAFQIANDGKIASIYVDPKDFPGVIRAAGDLADDVHKVTGTAATLSQSTSGIAGRPILIGTIGHSEIIGKLIAEKKIDVTAIDGKWESTLTAVVDHPLPGVDSALVIVGSDKRGTIYGIYDISAKIGVSPWYWWADVPPEHHEALFVAPSTSVQGPPKVKYRGIFINDEDPALGGWSRAKFGGINSKMYTHMFELLLRLRANYLWPAMWGKAFNEDDPENPRLADEYGIVMGTSHHEPMIRAQAEWGKHKSKYGNGEWNYGTNEAGLRQFWTDGIERNKAYESVVTIGMRGDGDVAMPDAGGLEANKKMLERIMHDQEQIIAEHLNPDQTKVPQLWALFTEVQQYYDAGLKVPDNVTLLFTDDNVGDSRRVPTAEERKRSGGSGVYFHMDMNGGPFSYKWLNSNPLPKIWEQMNLADQYGATQIWIVNVGDLKPLEVPIEFFLSMAWDPHSISKESIGEWTQQWAQRQFGSEHAAEIADLIAKYAKYNGWRKPELIRADTFSLVNYREAERASQAWDQIAAKALALNDSLPADQRDAYYELVLHPTEACGNLVDLYIAAGRNALFAKQGRASANAQAAHVRELFKKDQDFSNFYNTKLAGGKWNHMMDQTHIGYTSWQSPRTNIMPKLTELTLADTAEFGVAVDGSAEAWPGSNGQAALPVCDSLNRQRSYVEIFARGTKPIEYKIAADQPWIHLTDEKASGIGEDRRVWVDIDWSKAPAGPSTGVITVSGSGTSVSVNVTAMKASSEQEREAAGCFGGLSGPIAFFAADATKNVPAGDVGWQTIPDYGRGPSAVEIFPVTAATVQPTQQAPHLEYPVYFARAGKYDVDLITGPTLDMVPGRGLGIAVSIDDQTPQVVNVFTPQTTKDETFLGRKFYGNTANNARTMRFAQTVTAPGRHTLTVWMVDPTVVVQKIIVHDSPLPASYFGPPEGQLNSIAP